MKKLEEYISVGQQELRCGYTTGTCAAAATRAAAELLLHGERVPVVTVSTPAGIDVAIDVEEHLSGDGWAQCAVRKDAGDDPDVTDGILVFVRVERCEEPGVSIDGGIGVGRVTREGLDQPVGAAAINSTPRAMIAEQVALAGFSEGGSDGGIAVVIAIPEGVEIAKKTFNPRLGIEGGISVIGTSGIVRPMSEEALIASIRLELNTLHAQGEQDVLIVPGNYGLDFARDQLGLHVEKAVSCSNYVGAVLDAASSLGFRRMLIVGHAGKMVKVAGGIMHTHSRMADCRTEIVAAHAACVGVSQDAVRAIMGAATTDATFDILAQEGLMRQTMDSIMASLADRLNHRAADNLQVEAIVFSKQYGLLGQTPHAEEFARIWADGKDEA